MNSRLSLDILCWRWALWITLLHSAFCGLAAAFPSFNVEDLCRAWRTSVIDLRHYGSGTLTSLTSGAQELTCIIRLKPGFDSSVVLSLYKYSLEPQEELVIEDAHGYKVGLIGEGNFGDERHSFQSDGDLILHYRKNRTMDFGYGSRTKFQFIFTEVHKSPCEFEEFQCRNLNCVPESLLCDRHNNCGDNSDEEDCGLRKNVQKEEPSPEVIVYQRSSVLIISIAVCSVLLGLVLIVFIVVLIRNASKNRKGDKAPVPLATVASSVSLPVAPSFVHPKQLRRLPQSVSGQKSDNYQVPSMYPEIPSAPEYSGIDNPEFKADE